MTKAVAELSWCLRVSSILLSKMGVGDELSLTTQALPGFFLGHFPVFAFSQLCACVCS